MTDQPCRTTQHCADHGYCHRCAPALAEASKHLVKAIAAAGIADKDTGYVYRQLAAVISAPTPRHTCCGSNIGHYIGCYANAASATKRTEERP